MELNAQDLLLFGRVVLSRVFRIATGSWYSLGKGVGWYGRRGNRVGGIHFRPNISTAYMGECKTQETYATLATRRDLLWSM